MALYDLHGQHYGLPVCCCSAAAAAIETDITISVNSPEEMARDAQNAVARGYNVLKCKVGREPEKDLARLAAIRSAAGPDRRLRIDANQGWNARQAAHP